MTETLDPYEGADDEAYTVRPYAVTGGRVSGASTDLPMEALVQARFRRTKCFAGSRPKRRKILQLAAGQYQSVAELSAHTRLPLGVVRVLVTDLAEEKYLTIHTSWDGRRRGNARCQWRTVPQPSGECP